MPALGAKQGYASEDLRALPLSLDDLRATLEPFAKARPLPPVVYADEAILAYERDAIFTANAWLCVARADDLEREGSWLLAPLTPEGVIVVRGSRGEISAFYNVCPHRGSTLVDASAGCAQRFECPYHGFRFALDGSSLAGDGRVAGLTALRAAVFAGFVFVTLDPSAPDIREGVASGARAWLAALPPLRRVRRAEWETRANWKLCVENFQESHHFRRVHPALEALTPCARSRSVLGDGPWFTGIMEIAGGAETVSKSGRFHGRPLIAPEAMRGHVYDAHLFPGMLWSLQPDYLLTYRVRAVSVDVTEIVADIYVHADCPEDADLDDVRAFWDVVNAEDRSICERQQVGVRSRGFARGTYATSEDGVHAFDRLVAQRYVDGLGLVEAPKTAPKPEPALGKLWGIWGRPYIDLSGDLDTSCFPDLDEEIAYGLARVETERTGGSLKWMNVVAPWVRDDGYIDYGHVIEKLSREEFERLISLADDPDAFDLDRRSEYTFGDETDHPLTQAQVRYLVYRHKVYFPWRDSYHLLENDRWEDKHSGAGKAISAEARANFPRTVAFIESLPFTEIGRAVIFGVEANDHAPLHRDSEPGVAMGVAQSISFSPRGKKRLYLTDPEGGGQTIVRARAYWFNDMDYHGVLPDPFWRYSIRVDGVFDPAWVRALERKHRRG